MCNTICITFYFCNYYVTRISDILRYTEYNETIEFLEKLKDHLSYSFNYTALRNIQLRML